VYIRSLENQLKQIWVDFKIEGTPNSYMVHTTINDNNYISINTTIKATIEDLITLITDELTISRTTLKKE
jgi:hypothetical protein